MYQWIRNPTLHGSMVTQVALALHISQEIVTRTRKAKYYFTICVCTTTFQIAALYNIFFFLILRVLWDIFGNVAHTAQAAGYCNEQVRGGGYKSRGCMETRTTPPHPSYIPPLPRNPAPGPGLAAPHHRYWRHLQLHFACTAPRRSLQQRQCEHCVSCIVYCVLCIVVFVYRIILCIGVVAGDGGMLQVVCCSFYDSITCAGRQLPPRHSPHRLCITPRPPSCMRSPTKLSAHTHISYWQAPRPWPSSFCLNPYPLAPSP